MMNNTPHHIIYILLLLLGAATPSFAQTIKGNVYGGGNLAQVEGSTTINVIDGTVSYQNVDDGNVYGGGYGASAVLTGNTTVNVAGGTVTKDVYGGGALANVTGSTEVNIQGGSITQDVYGGGALANVEQNTSVNLTGGTLRNSYGGGLGSAEVAALVNGNATVNLGVMVDDGEGNLSPSGTATADNIFGCNNINGAPQGAVTVTTTSGTVNHNVYGGGNQAAASVSPIVNINGGIITENVYGGGYGATAVITGSPVVTVAGGTVSQDVYGGGALANVMGSTEVNIQGGTITQDVYGGGALANVGVNTAVNLTGGSIRSSYGGGLGSNEVAALIGGDATTTLNGTVVNGSVFGCNNLNGTPQGHAKVHVLSTAERDGQSAEDYDVAAVYGGGNLAAYIPSDATLANAEKNFAEVLIENCDNSIAYVYGGGNAAPVPATKVTIKGANAIDNAFAGGNGAGADNPGADIGYKGFFSSGAATEYGTGIATINVQGGTIHHVYGGSNTLGYIKDHAEVNVEADGTCTMDVAELYGGGKMAPGKAATINIACTGEGTIDNVYGGAHMADLTGDIELNIRGGQIGNVFGGNNVSGTINGAITVNVNWATGPEACGTNSLDNVYGGGNKADYAGSPAVKILHGTVNENVFGGGLEATVTGDPIVTIDGGTVTLGAYGGGALADVDGTTTVKIISGTVGNAYGGGLGQLADAVAGKEAVAATVTGANVTVSGGTTTNVFGCNNLNGSPEGDVTVTINGTANVTNVYGGGNQASASVSPVVNINGGTSDKVYGGGYGATAVLTGSPMVNVSGGTVSNDVYGGGALANVTGDPTINVSGGTVTHDVYGGGALADVTGNTTVNLTGGAVGGAYGGALGSDVVAAKVYGDTYVHLDGSKVTETGIFGANNLNGTPTGHVKVHVTRTTPRDGEDYDVPAVYGGGNLSAYVPTDADDYAEVLIENCDNSIEYVYGGGNAAPVPATDVKIYGANAIDNAFAGGNGAGDGNPGADIGYQEYTRDEEHKYGAGTTHISIYGGTVNNVFGGSNTLGYIRTHAYVDVPSYPDDYKGSQCNLVLGNVHAGGNQAEMYCGGSVTLSCSDGADVVYAGANAADIHGDITLTIASGTYGKVFGGNNQSGNVYGSISVNIDETGCWPVMIGELYGCGNDAAYSVYGYNDDKSCKTSGEKLYEDPVINIYSCTGIGRIFGGGKGSGATVYGNPTVNINTIKGSFAGQDFIPLYILDANCERIENNNELTRIEDNVGKIGTVYGGGNQAAVHGNTTVNIGTLATNKHLNAAPEAPKETVSVRITDNVFGGGKTAEVTGKATVTIGKDQQ